MTTNPGHFEDPERYRPRTEPIAVVVAAVPGAEGKPSGRLPDWAVIVALVCVVVGFALLLTVFGAFG